MVNESRIARVLAPNPSPMTLDGTNTYVIDMGAGAALVIDPGPPIASHIDAILEHARARELRIEKIAVTHGHPDHAPGAALLHARTQAPVYAHAAARFPHDETVGENDTIAAGTSSLKVVDAPGHARDHVVFYDDREAALFTGDVILGRGTTVIAPPGGDMRDYLRTLHKLRARFAGAARIYGGHGDPLDDPAATFDAYIRRREEREAQILAVLAETSATVPALVERVYAETSRELWPAAARQVLAYLIALENEGTIRRVRLDRAPTKEELALLNPDLSRVVDPSIAAVAAAELGLDTTVDTLDRYELTQAHTIG